jgi:exo-1,4-beta-D-glucosaminidase
MTSLHRRLGWIPTLTWLVASTALGQGTPAASLASRAELVSNWRIQSSARVSAPGDSISTTQFKATDWYPASAPTTVLAALVANKVYPDPYIGMNLRSIPGTSYPIGKNFANLPMSDDSPFRVPWWYRKTFELPALMRGKHVALHFDGINYRANIWLNGHMIARSDSVLGTYRLYEFDVSDVVKKSGVNVLAVEVSAPEVLDLAMTWVDWNPAPPDKDMGIWRPVYLTASGRVALRYPHVMTRVDGSTLGAELGVSVEATNLSSAPVWAVVRGRIGDIAFKQSVELAPNKPTLVRFTVESFKQLRIAKPRLWWPVGMGAQPLNDLDLSADVAGVTSDRAKVRFGIRQITSEFTRGGARLFRVNGRRVVIFGGGWAPDMMMRATPERQDAEMRYARDMHLNTIRLEGKLEDEHLFDLADKYGILMLAGWSCCDQWEKWKTWTREDTVVAEHSQRDQIRRLRNRPSILAWMNGSDNPPPTAVESMYVAILKEYEWPNPYISSATAKPTQYTGASGVKMNGPYDWVPPAYWMLDSTRGGGAGFATEISPGAAVPPMESLRRMFPTGVTWPPDSAWILHAAGGQFANLTAFSNALGGRYGPATSAEDFAAKSQLMTYEGERAMFEAYSRNRGTSTGVIQWMLNDAWPGLYWHLYDYYLRPGGGYFGTKKALEPVHAMYSYDDRSVAVVNETLKPVKGALLTVRMLALDGSILFRDAAMLDLAVDSVVRPIVLPQPPAGTTAYFVDLRILSHDGQPLSTNFYWLSKTMDDPDWDKSTWYITPVKSYANFTALDSLAPTTVKRLMVTERNGASETAYVTLTNTGKVPAFFLRLQITKGKGGDEVLPVLWQDNYVSLLPGETRRISATYAVAILSGRSASLVVSGSNLKKASP